MASLKNCLIALLFGFLAISSFAQDPSQAPQESAQPEEDIAQVGEVENRSTAHEEWKCNHDHVAHDPQFEKIEEEGLEAAQRGDRRLSGHPSFRTYGYYGLMGSGSYKNYAENQLVPPILAYFEAALKVKYPVSGSLKINSNSVCGESTPSVLRAGVNADFFYMFKTDSAGGNWVASSSPCSLADGSKRPIVAMTTLNTAMMNLPGNDALLHEKNVICIMHEITHTLGFSNILFPHFLDDNGNRKDVVKDSSLDGARCQIIEAEPLTSKLQSYFGCSSLQGAYMENSGSEGTAGSHFERRQFGMEAMTSGNIYEMKFSKFSLAMLESSGWYVADYDYADPFFFGQGQGCSFLTGKCSANNFDDFCNSNSRSCTIAGGSGGSCDSDSRSDNCKFVRSNVNWHCENSGARSSARLGSAEVYGAGLNSKCFTGTLSEGHSSSSTSFCFQYSCEGSGSNTVLNVEVGRATVACTSRGTKTVSGYSGTFDCPDPLNFCSTVGKKSCPRNCMGRGNCVNGGCNCYSGYKGESCSLTD